MLDTIEKLKPAAGTDGVIGIVVEGYRVASGLTQEPYFHGGSIRQQLPFFARAGLKRANEIWPGTINIRMYDKFDFDGLKPELDETIQWHPAYCERFLLYPASLEHQGQSKNGYIYRIDPETKAGHQHDDLVVEVIMPRFENLAYDDSVWLRF